MSMTVNDLDIHRDSSLEASPTHVGEQFENPVTGERAVVRIPPTQANGHLLVADLYVRPGGAVAGEHVHPGFTETFTVVRGELDVCRFGCQLRSGAGTRIRIPPGTAHEFWNAGSEEARAVVEVQPGERLVELIRQLFLLAQDGRTNARGRPRLLQAAAIGQQFADTIQFTSPAQPLQRLLLGVLGPIARATGHRALDPAYLARELPTVDLEPLPDEIARRIPGLAASTT